MKNWISVNERLPEHREMVLCCGSRGGMFVGWFGTQIDIDRGRALAYMHGGMGRYATHWMPLPERPKKEKKDATD